MVTYVDDFFCRCRVLVTSNGFAKFHTRKLRVLLKQWMRDVKQLTKISSYLLIHNIKSVASFHVSASYLHVNLNINTCTSLVRFFQQPTTMREEVLYEVFLDL